MIKMILHVEGMACGMCETHINEAVRNAFSVKKVTSSHTKKETVILAENELDEQKLRDVIEKTGYEVGAVSVEPYEKKGFPGRWRSNKKQDTITQKGNPRKPQGTEGEQMLLRMNESHSKVTEWALGFLHFGEQDQVLDIGCGGGATLKRMSRHITAGHLTGVDYSEVSVKLSEEMNEEDIRSGKMEVLEASVEKLPFEEETFDKIVTVESFYFWPNPAENLKEVLRILKKGGVFLLVADIYQKEKMSTETLENIRRYQMFNPTEVEFRELFEQAGFASVKIHTKGGEDWICVEGVR